MRSLYTIALIAFLALPKASFSDENPHQNADKVLAILKKVDIEHEYLTDTVRFIDERMDGGYFNFGSENLAGYDFQLRYDADSLKSENLQLYITQPDANYAITASSKGAIFSYKMEF